MDRPRLRYVAIPVLVLTVFLALVYVNFGTAFGWEVGVLRSFAFASMVVGLPGIYFTDGRARLYIVLALAGVLAFIVGVGGSVCNLMGYPESAEHGITYDVTENLLRFGDNIDGTRYRCEATPDRLVSLLGYGLTSVGLAGFLGRRRDGGQ